MKLNRRLEALEREINCEPIVLHMPDGRIERLPANQATGILARFVHKKRSHEIDLGAQSISSTEPGGGHLIDLARAILNSPLEDAR